MVVMSSLRSNLPVNLKTSVGLLALLTLLAILQYRWLGQVGEAEHERMRANLSTAITNFANDFDQEIARAFLYFHLNPRVNVPSRGDHLAERYRLWQDESPHPDLVKGLFLSERDDAGRFGLTRLDPARGQFESTSWTAELDRLRTRLQDERPPDRPHREPIPLIILGDIPALVIPAPPSERHARFGNRRERFMKPELDSLVIVQLELSYIQDMFLPELAARYFETRGELDYELVVFQADDSRTVLFQSNPETPFVVGDASARLFGPVRIDDLHRLWLETGFGMEGARPPGAQPFGRGRGRRTRFPDTELEEVGAWRLIVRHRAGSLETAVSQARRRNLAVSLGILALLAVSVVMIVLSTQRAQRLAKQQVEFVAGVTHELQTPLAVIRSAGQNLADGVVDGKEQVKEYGSLVEKEGRRLSVMVDQVLEFAGLQSQRRALTMEAIPIDRVIESALSDCEAAIEESGFRVEKEVEPRLTVMADASALRRAIQNLIDNAIKYGGDAKWLGLGAKVGKKGSKREALITVADRGPGISSEDLPHVFEPFYRGKKAQAGRARGNGLGLALVRQIVEGHGGKLTVKSTKGQGTIFHIHLPHIPTGTEPKKS